MAIFPKVQNPCPLAGRVAEFMDGDTCRACQRQVFDLSAMTDGERRAFMAGCEGKVCVSYTMRLRPVVAAAMIATGLAIPAAASASDATNEIVIVLGGIEDPANTEYVEDASDSAIPVLPVVHEEDGEDR
jgi:hypothetical protein